MDIKEHGEVLVSVVMPACNCEKFIEKAVRSVLNQTVRDLELIVVDDGSTDATEAILEKLAQEDDRIKLMVNAENLGVAKSRNHGLDLSCGIFPCLLHGTGHITGSGCHGRDTAYQNYHGHKQKTTKIFFVH